MSTIGLVWGDGGYPVLRLGWAEGVLALQVEIIPCRLRSSERIPGRERIPRAAPQFGLVQRTVARITRHRRCVRAYGSRPDHHEAVIHVAEVVG
ncbi:hypothetical protein P3H15_44000 [Rhodococcus sp. T2V]|uniref:hypothetical protein n=1 Tax=Rhodococcus sp. T2V TaxID=3034164 RepID=UPI0023E21846|nr:hypothetical protein [Rhodococcus sp. T2V]MDF3311940.1 hypothetical protein [Rhodococcus sp. T2V]